jgi:hypothetical protein
MNSGCPQCVSESPWLQPSPLYRFLTHQSLTHRSRTHSRTQTILRQVQPLDWVQSALQTGQYSCACSEFLLDGGKLCCQEQIFGGQCHNFCLCIFKARIVLTNFCNNCCSLLCNRPRRWHWKVERKKERQVLAKNLGCWRLWGSFFSCW